jgi:hypothetical protein
MRHAGSFLAESSTPAGGARGVSLPHWRGRVRKVGHAALAICA